MKCEYANSVIYKACAVKPKMYALQYISRFLADDNTYQYSRHPDQLRRFKGLPRSAIKNQTNFEQHAECLFIPIQYYAVFKKIRSLNHKLHTIEMKRKAVSGLCLKRFSLSAIHTQAFGNVEIRDMACI